MIKLLALYKNPDDVDSFMEHYENVHTPLVQKVPGIERLVVNRITADAFGGEPQFFLIAEMHFPDQETFDQAMRSDENKAVGKDAMQFAKGLITVLIADSTAV